MKHFWRVNIYETQALLYFILGVLILHLGTWHWLGYLSIGYGWATLLTAITYTGIYRKEILKGFL